MTNKLLEVEKLSVHFPVKGRDSNGKKKTLIAVDEVSFTIPRGKTLGLVGESGSGKTTTALAVARLIDAQGGQVKLEGDDFLSLDAKQLRQARQRIQFIFQDPYSSLNPRVRAEDIVQEPLLSLSQAYRDKSPEEKTQLVDEMFAAVGLRPEQKRLFPHQFSGGQRQRIGIARALATRPQLIICDEPVSALDVAVQAQILNLLRDLQKQFNLTSLFISHDMGVVQYICDEIAVMYMGRIVEQASRKNLFRNPTHPYTKALLASIPTIESIRRLDSDTSPNAPQDNNQVQQYRIKAAAPDLTLPAKGCRFAASCALVQDICHTRIPVLHNITSVDGHQDAHRVACHLAT